MIRREYLKSSAAVASTITFAGCQSLTADSNEQAVECADQEYEWPAYRASGTRTNVTDQSFPDTGGNIEQFSEAASRDVLGVTAPPVADSDTLYIPRLSHIEARDTESGAFQWRNAVEGGLRTAPALGCGLVFVATKKSLYAMKLGDGTIQWRRDIVGGTKPDQSPVFADGTVYTVGYDDVLTAVDVTGDVSWQTELDANINGLSLGEHIYLSSDYYEDGNGGVISIDQSGDERWRQDLEHVEMAPAIQNGALYFVSEYGRLCAVSIDGDVLWKEQIGFTPARTPAVAHDFVYVDAGGRNECLAFDSESGEQQWEYETGMTGSGVLATSDHVYATGSNSGVHKLDPATGNRVEQYPDIVYVDSDLVVQGDSVFYLEGTSTELYQYSA